MSNNGKYVQGHGFDKNPQNINRKGQPKKLYKQHIEDIKAKGYQAPNKPEFYEMIGLLLSMNEADLKEFAGDVQRPYWIRCIIVDLSNKQTRQKMMADYRDWLYGKAEQKSDITSGGEKIGITIIANENNL